MQDFLLFCSVSGIPSMAIIWRGRGWESKFSIPKKNTNSIFFSASLLNVKFIKRTRSISWITDNSTSVTDRRPD